MTKVLLIAALVFVFPLVVFGQSSDVNGRVEDALKKPVSGAAVILRNKQTLAERTAVSDGEGRFTFGNVGAGQFEIIVTAAGFTRQAQDVGAGEVVLVLAPEGIREQVTVTATRTQVATEDTAEPVSVVDREELEQKQINTLGDVFRTLPGTATNNEGAFQVRPRIRGLESNRVLILVDGERLNNSRTSTGQSGVEPGLVDMSQIESVEVVRGAGSVLYGTDALAGTINIITRDTPARLEKGFHFGAAFSTFYSSNEHGRRGYAAVTGSGNKFAFRLSQSMERFGNYFTGKADGAVPGDVLAIGGITGQGEVLNSQSHGSNTHATVRFFLNDTNTFRLNYERRRASNIGSSTLVDVFNAFFPYSDRDKFSARYDVAALTDKLQRLSLNTYYQKQPRNFTNILTVPPVPPFFPGMYQFSETVTATNTFGYDLQTDWKLGERHMIVAGTSFFRDDNTDRRLIITATTPSDPNRTVRTSRSVPDAALSNIGIFVHDEFRVSNRLRLIGGLRFDRFATHARPTTEFTIDPRFTQSQIEDLGLSGLTSGLSVANKAVTGDAGFVFRLSDKWSASARIGRSFRTPNIFERFFTDFGSVAGFLVGNPRLRPESGINIDTGLKFRSSHMAVSIAYFNNTYSNFLATPEALDRNGQPIVIPRPPLDRSRFIRPKTSGGRVFRDSRPSSKRRSRSRSAISRRTATFRTCAATISLITYRLIR